MASWPHGLMASRPRVRLLSTHSIFFGSTLDAERALASLEKTGEALTGIGGGDVRCSMSDVRCSMSDVRCSMLDVRCAMCDVRCPMFDVRCAMCDVRCSMCDVRCAMFDVRGVHEVMATRRRAKSLLLLARARGMRTVTRSTPASNPLDSTWIRTGVASG